MNIALLITPVIDFIFNIIFIGTNIYKQFDLLGVVHNRHGGIIAVLTRWLIKKDMKKHICREINKICASNGRTKCPDFILKIMQVF